MAIYYPGPTYCYPPLPPSLVVGLYFVPVPPQFAICNELRKPTTQRVDGVIMSSVLIAFTVYVIVAIAGYVTFGSYVSSDILNSYGSSGWVTLARSFVALLVSFSYPLQAHPARACLMSLVGRLWPGALEDTRVVAIKRVVTFCFLALSFSVALAVTDLGVILGIVGATGSTMVSYVLPGLCYYLAFREPHLKRQMALAQFLLGLLIIPVALTTIFMNMNS